MLHLRAFGTSYGRKFQMLLKMKEFTDRFVVLIH